jgi:hypothetical protein
MHSKTRKSKPPYLGQMRSKYERTVANWLFEQGVEYEYETYQFEYEEPLRKNRAKCSDCDGTNLVRMGWYTPDFYIPRSHLFIETKGRWTAADRRKMLAVTNQHPDETFVMLFMRDNRITKRSATSYTDWCGANNIDSSVGLPKKEWLE